MGISQTQLARDLDVPASRIAGVIAGKRAITADTALRLARYFGSTAELWLNLQTAYDLRVAKRASWPQIKERVRVRKETPRP